MSITAALQELISVEPTQSAVAERLTAAGFPTDQPKVSAWMRGRVPNVEQLATIEDVFERPRGWVLAKAGFVDPRALVATGSSGGGAPAATPGELRALHAEVRRLRRALAVAESAALRLHEAAQISPARAPQSKTHTSTPRGRR